MNHKRVDFEGAKQLYQKGGTCGSIIKSPRMFGVELEMIPDPAIHNTLPKINSVHLITEKIIPSAWGNAHDGSITPSAYGVEIQTAPMRLSVGQDSLVNFCNKVKELGWTTDSSCGVHVHLDANDIRQKPELVRRLFLLYFVLDYSILATVPKDRRTNVFCAPLDKTKSSKLLRHSNRVYDKGWDINKILSTQPTKRDFLEMYYKTPYDEVPSELREHFNEARYHGINFHPLFGVYGTVEVRYLEGTLDGDLIVKWVALHQHIVDSARLIREVEAIELFHIKGPKTRLRRFAEMTNMPCELLEFSCNRIDQFKD